MSRSQKKYPIRWFKGCSAKQDKRMCNRILRRISKQRIGQNEEPLHSIKESTKKMGGFKVVGKTPFQVKSGKNWGINYSRK